MHSHTVYIYAHIHVHTQQTRSQPSWWAPFSVCFWPLCKIRGYASLLCFSFLLCEMSEYKWMTWFQSTSLIFYKVCWEANLLVEGVFLNQETAWQRSGHMKEGRTPPRGKWNPVGGRGYRSCQPKHCLPFCSRLVLAARYLWHASPDEILYLILPLFPLCANHCAGGWRGLPWPQFLPPCFGMSPTNPFTERGQL